MRGPNALKFWAVFRASIPKHILAEVKVKVKVKVFTLQLDTA
jgi:hypothetical protein